MPLSLGQITVDNVVDLPALNVPFKLRHIQTQVTSELDDKFIVKLIIVIEKQGV